MTIEQANEYFSSLPEGFAPTEELSAALTADARKVQFVGVAGTAGKTAAAGLLAAILREAAFHTGFYRAGCEPLSARIAIGGVSVDPVLFCQAAEALSAAKPLPRAAAELAAAACCFGAADCKLAVVELPDAGLAAALPSMPVCAVTAIGPDGVSRSVERLAALAAGVMRKGAVCVTAPEQPKAVLSELVVAAAKAAHADSFIRRLPEGYDTVIAEDGGNISQGQKQLLCIARVMLCLPSMLILDEATSSIDTRTEVRIQAAFARMMQGRTSFIVAHRLSTIREADVILVMKDGHIVEQGDHDTLLAQGGFYAKLYNSQFEGVET